MCVDGDDAFWQPLTEWTAQRLKWSRASGTARASKTALLCPLSSPNQYYTPVRKSMAVAAEAAGDLTDMLNISDRSTQKTPAQETLQSTGAGGQRDRSWVRAQGGQWWAQAHV